ncbi:MAG: ATP-binding cassette domain-containing protein [Ignavibacteriaceae bacterium]|nr:ATP-binding cassette domain-containing protein [Ignavibacteriaceae bacterium]MCU0406069.1 ATP-binding cassette domain-containing protein [Ignavibacteriaceae bacterium]
MLSVDINLVSLLDEDKRKTILQHIKFDIGKGKVYTILGKNGSGKSTLIRSLTSLLPTDLYEVKGKALFEGTDLLQTSEEKLREIRKNNIRYVFQDAANSFDPLKNIKYYFDLSNISPLKIEELLLYFLLPDYKKLSKLHSYELSGGMAQRLLIVLALLANPDILILDEPTSGVDYAVMNLILLKMKNFVRDNDKSVLIVTQDINFALKSSDQIAYLSDGRLTHFFTPDKLLNSPDEKVKNFIGSFKELSNVTA